MSSIVIINNTKDDEGKVRERQERKPSSLTPINMSGILQVFISKDSLDYFDSDTDENFERSYEEFLRFIKQENKEDFRHEFSGLNDVRPA